MSVQGTNSAATTARRDQTSSSLSSPPLKCVTGPSSSLALSLAGPPPVVASAFPFELTSFPLMTDNHSSLPPSAGGGRAGEATHRRRREEGRRITSDLTDSWRSVDRRRRRYRATTCSRFSVLSPSLSSLVIDTLSPQNEGTGERASERTNKQSLRR